MFKSTVHLYCAILHADYVELTPPQAVTLPAGPASETCFSGDIIDDKLALEPVEQFTLRLRDPVIQDVLIGNDETVVSIIDDDGMYLCACIHVLVHDFFYFFTCFLCELSSVTFVLLSG